eukprot:comp22444_c0_seq1/m.33711 comp22444_c0_seq1/g.33711  ORF comp22444_c0_seq1/g.33711 comp22444_c0_seq1/m.33711 type:complete len:524 (-) comp22444_c0_seq1:567-2138(-)
MAKGKDPPTEVTARPGPGLKLTTAATPEEAVNCMKRLFASPPTPGGGSGSAWDLATPPPPCVRTVTGLQAPGATPAKNVLGGHRAGLLPPSTAATKRQRSAQKRGPNVNPFTPQPSLPAARTPTEVAEGAVEGSRYAAEFEEVGLLGAGQYGTVAKAINRLDGCMYAVKRTKKPFRGSAEEQEMLREVYAHAVLGASNHVVRYYSAWEEDGHMLIQNEYCPHGSLHDLMEQRNEVPQQAELADMLLQLAEGLKFLHAHQIVHMDLKPGNVFVASAWDDPQPEQLPAIAEETAQPAATPDDTKKAQTETGTVAATPQPSPPRASGGSMDTAGEEGKQKRPLVNHRYVYKIGDLGHATSLVAPQITDEGDCRYLPMEVLQETYKDLRKADIFSLGISIWELGTGTSLPLNGDQWQALREGRVPNMEQCSDQFNVLVQAMMAADAAQRPTAEDVVRQVEEMLAATLPTSKKSRTQLALELDRIKQQSQQLKRELALARRQPQRAPCMLQDGETSLARFKRSQSTQW